MATPYVQDVSKWINYYSRHGTSTPNVGGHNDSTLSSDTGGLAQESKMGVSKVEPHGPPPPTPHTGPSMSLQSVTPSQESVVQAVYTTKRVLLDKTQTNGKRARPANSSKKKQVSGKVKKPTKKKANLFGTPGDIFKSRADTKRKKKTK